MSKYSSSLWSVTLSDSKYGHYTETVTAMDEEGAKEAALYYNCQATVVRVQEILPRRFEE